jgi:putative copper resistance protein D
MEPEHASWGTATAAEDPAPALPATTTPMDTSSEDATHDTSLADITVPDASISGSAAGRGAATAGAGGGEPGAGSATGSSAGRWRVAAGVAAGTVAMLATLVIMLEFDGGAPKRLPAELSGADPGLVTGWGLPISRMLCDAAGAGTVGTLLAAAFLFPAAGGRPGAAGRRMLRWASLAAWLWCAASLAQFVFTVSDLIGKPLPGALAAHDIDNVLNAVPQPRALLINAVICFAVAVGAGLSRKLDTAGWLAVLALGALLPVAMTGHSHGSGGHDLATVSAGLHVLSVAAWVGGLAALLAGGRRLAGPELVTAVRRYSGIAGLCLVVVTVSGVVNAYVRVVAFDALFDSRYGKLVLVKTGLLVALAGCGAAHRQYTIRRLAADPAGTAARRPFLRLGLAELAVMGVAIALPTPPVPTTRSSPFSATRCRRRSPSPGCSPRRGPTCCS